MPRPARALRASGMAFCFALALGAANASCKKAEVGLSVTVPAEIGNQINWIEVGAFPEARCAALTPMLPAGVPNGAATRLSFRIDDATFPRVGKLPNTPYAFAAVARDPSCGVVATGCTEVQLDEVDAVELPLSKLVPRASGCDASATCTAGRCVPISNNANPAIGAGCSLELLGAGPLPAPLGAGSYVSAPAIATTSSGFIVAYREANDVGARVTLLPLDASGGFGKATQPRLAWPCADPSEVDGVGLVMKGDDGQVVLARPACDKNAGLELVTFHGTQAIKVDAPWTNPAPGSKVSLSFGHIAANRASDQIVVFLRNDAPGVATIRPGQGIVGPAGTFGGGSNMTGSWVAASTTALALLAADSSATLHLTLSAASTALSEFDVAQAKPGQTTTTFPGQWGVPAAENSRVIVLSKNAKPDGDVVYRTFDVGAKAEAPTPLVIDGAGATIAADATLLGDRAFFALARPGDVEVLGYAGASATPSLIRRVALAAQPETVTAANVRDGRVAIAASDARVAVVWTTTTNSTQDDDTGGYAVFACTP